MTKRRSRLSLFSKANKNRRVGNHVKNDDGKGDNTPFIGHHIQQLSTLFYRFTLVAFVLTAVGFSSYWGYHKILTTKYFDIAKIEFKGIKHTVESDLREQIRAVEGHSIFRIRLDEIVGVLLQDPWVAHVKVRRQLPNSLMVTIEEHEAVASILLEKLYLISDKGVLFKRAELAEAEDLPVITGVARDDYINYQTTSRKKILKAIHALNSYQSKKRPPLSEVHIGRSGDFTFFLEKRGVALRFGQTINSKKLAQMDAVWAALGTKRKLARSFFFDHQLHGDRVVVRMAEESLQL